MHPLMNRLTELLGPDAAQRLAEEFGGQVIYIPKPEACAKPDSDGYVALQALGLAKPIRLKLSELDADRFSQLLHTPSK